MITYEQAVKLVEQNVKGKNRRNHMYAVEAICRRLAQVYNKDEHIFGLAGLLHDIDYDQTAKDPKQHSIIGSNFLKEQGLPDNIVYAVKVHNAAHGLPRISLLDKVLYAADPLSGLIVASALIHPSKKIKNINKDSVMRRFAEKTFARGANRNQIKACEEFGMTLEQFIGYGYEAMLNIAEKLGL